MPTCPNGHQSTADDWCEVCGHRMSGTPMPAGAVPPPPPPPMPGAPGAPGGYGFPGPAGPPPHGPGASPPGGPGAPPPYGGPGAPPPYGGPGAPPPPPGGTGGGYGYPGAPTPPQPDATFQAELCPQCRTPREAQAPFCEECRFNFLTQSPTPYSPPSSGGFAPPPLPGPPQPFPPQGQQPPHGGDYQASRPSQMNRPAEPLPSAEPGPPPGQGFGDDDWTLPPPQAGAGPAAPPQQPQQPQPQYGYGYPQPPQGAAQPAPPAPPYGHDEFPGAAPPPPPPAYQGHPGPPPPPQQQHATPPSPFEHGGAPPSPAGWVAVVAPDREYFMAMMHRSGPEAAGLNLPAYSPEQQLPLNGQQITIGRRRHSTGESPDIDLGRPPEDPGVSHQHAVLVQQPDGSWSVVDQDSTNGTTINGGEDPIQPYVPIPLQDGDRVHVGAWTTITVRRG
ncbi:FHA domain-containing protein [Streptomyces sp. NPDC048636]|uniref:FHA domain-containing protein n=1 Tax=Streptomyces sp. NPDC048636 TaxID=3155762 RepID=UPI003428C004